MRGEGIIYVIIFYAVIFYFFFKNGKGESLTEVVDPPLPKMSSPQTDQNIIITANHEPLPELANPFAYSMSTP